MAALLVVAILGACSYSSEYVAQSGPATVGDVIEYQVNTVCGLGQSVFDLDGSLWAPLDIDTTDLGPPDGVDAPTDVGTLTLVAADRAVYRSSSGREFALTRRQGTQVNHEC